MRLAPYRHLVRTAFLKLMAYRMRYVTGIATYAVFVGVHYFIWRAVFAAREVAPGERLDGLSLAELTTYLAVGYMARAAYYNNLDSEIAARFQNGDVVMDLLRPIDFHGNWLSQAIGETAFRIVFFALPMSLVIVPLFGVQPPAGDGWWQFPVLFAIAFLVFAELNLLTGTCSFFLEDITGLMSLKRNLLMLASGLMVPLHYLEGLIGRGGVEAVTALPFALIGYYPVIAYVGRLGTDGIRGFDQILMLAAVWLVVLRVVNVWMWSVARRRLEVQGG